MTTQTSTALSQSAALDPRTREELAAATAADAHYCALCLRPDRRTLAATDLDPEPEVYGCTCGPTGLPTRRRWLTPAELPHARRVRAAYDALADLEDYRTRGDRGSEHTDDDVVELLAGVLPAGVLLAALDQHTDLEDQGPDQLDDYSRTLWHLHELTSIRASRARRRRREEEAELDGFIICSSCDRPRGARHTCPD